MSVEFAPGVLLCLLGGILIVKGGYKWRYSTMIGRRNPITKALIISGGLEVNLRWVSASSVELSPSVWRSFKMAVSDARLPREVHCHSCCLDPESTGHFDCASREMTHYHADLEPELYKKGIYYCQECGNAVEVV